MRSWRLWGDRGLKLASQFTGRSFQKKKKRSPDLDWDESSRGNMWKHLQRQHKVGESWTVNPFLASFAEISNVHRMTSRSVHMTFVLWVLSAQPCDALRFLLHLLSGLKSRRLEERRPLGFNCFHLHLQLTSPPQSVFKHLSWPFLLCTCSPRLSCLFRMIPQLISQRPQRSSGVKWEFLVSSCCNNKSNCSGEHPPETALTHLWAHRKLR